MKFYSLTTTVLSYKWVILIALLFSILNGQAQDGNATDNNLIGSWTLNLSSSMAGMALEDKESLDASPEVKNKIFQRFSNRTLVFDANGNFSQSDGLGNQMSGTWNLQGQTLVVTSPTGNQWVQQIIQLSRDQLVLQQQSKGIATPIFPQLYLTKNQ
ncbi:lipocalin family protein [Allomuricauda sp. F6463D]|uniref:lipocalin family protein n=1 Tax=Allomuricauda sp. F6463D TaxID=2926409 RepID=UPI001FF581D4|nr:lipocalin family protein [Muricauda sp. F6463D]MCK0160136.1 lipocalin family protein [Muricauda sp. F6463D]